MNDEDAFFAQVFEGVPEVDAHRDLRAETAKEIGQLRAQGYDAATLAGFAPQIVVRAWSRLRARLEPRPLGSRDVSPADVPTDAPTDGAATSARPAVDDVSRNMPYAGFFTLENSTYTHARFDGTRSGTMERAIFHMADAVTVLPYDPVRDRVLVVEQLRFGAYGRGDGHPWVYEPVAGRIDAGEGTEATARREAVEEAGVTLGALHHVASYYVSPGAVTEFVTSYVGLCELGDDAAGLGGLASEQEDIRSHLMSFDALMALCDAGALDTGPLYISALWLARFRDRLRANDA